MGRAGTFGERPELEAIATLLDAPLEVYYHLPSDSTDGTTPYAPKEVILPPTAEGATTATPAGGAEAAAAITAAA
eukprot:4818327-Prymnesium_polylepis.1